MDDRRRRTSRSGTLDGMDLEDLDELDLAYLLIFGAHPDLSVATPTVEP